jgi:hypothetical protein
MLCDYSTSLRISAIFTDTVTHIHSGTNISVGLVTKVTMKINIVNLLSNNYNKNIDIKPRRAWHASETTSIRHDQSQRANPNNLKVWGAIKPKSLNRRAIIG